MFLLIAMSILTFASALSVDDVKNYWVSQGLSESEAESIAYGSSEQKEKIEIKAQTIQDNNKVLNEINQTELIEFEEEQDQARKSSGVILMIVMFVFLGILLLYLIFQFIGWGG